MVVMTFLINGIIVKQTIENNALKNKINDLEEKTNDKINELAINFINSKTILNQNIEKTSQQLNELKVEKEGDFSGIIEDSLNSIVIIRTLYMQGTGFFISENGFIVTNAHILANENSELSNIIQAITYDDKIYLVEYYGYIKELDLALLKIEKETTPLKLANSDNVQIGEKVIAIGTPEGFSFSVTDGIVSGINRVGFNGISAYIQTNAELNQGNSGGPLIDKKGEVIGMNNFKLVDSEGIGFALESNKIKEGTNLIYEELYNETLINY